MAINATVAKVMVLVVLFPMAPRQIYRLMEKHGYLFLLRWFTISTIHQ
jgi:hypothetical protein